MTYLYIDIETLPAQDPADREYFAKTAKIDSRLKDPEKIEAAREEAVAKSSLDGWFGSICCIGMAIDDGAITVPTVSDGASEADIIESLFSLFSDYDRPTIVGHNVASFDVPFITRRAVSLGVELPARYLWHRDPKPWYKTINDTMVMAAGSRDRISLDKLCHALGIPGKNGFDGGMVAEAWANGEREKVAEYCADDVRRVRDIHKRFIQAGW